MNPTLARRFFLITLTVLGTTLLPWLYYAGYMGQDYQLNLGLDLRGGASITYRVTAAEEQEQSQAEILADAISVTRFRVDQFGVGEVNIVESGVDQFTVELPGRGKEEIDRIKGIMSTVGNLEFRIVANADITRTEARKKQEEEAAAEAEDRKSTYEAPPGYAWYPDKDSGRELLVELPEVPLRQKLEQLKAEGASPEAIAAAERELQITLDTLVFTGDDLLSAGSMRNPQGLGFIVTFSLVPAKKQAFGDFTGSHIEDQMAIILSDVIETAPVINSKLPGGGQISSDANPYTPEQAQDLATVLQSGSLQAEPEEISSFVVGPGLGEDAVRKGGIAVIISLVLVVLMMAVLYRGSGLVANIALVLNLGMTLGVLIFLDAALSLPGIAGLLLTLGMAVDANILVFERIREELDSGKGMVQALTAGYDRAFITIVDANLTTIITAAILYGVGTGPVRGFALTLILGLFISMFTALYVTRTLFLWGIDKGLLKEMRMMRVLGKRTFSFMDARSWMLRASVFVILAGTTAFALRPAADKYDLEFTGGQRVVVQLAEPMDIDRVREIITEAGYREAAIRTIRGRGSATAELDLSRQSDAFEITARIADENEGREFTRKIEGAFTTYLIPPAVDILSVGTGEDGTAVFEAAVTFETESLTADEFRDLLRLAPDAFPDVDALAIEPRETIAGEVAYAVSGPYSPPEKDNDDARRLVITEGILLAVDASESDVELSEPIPQSDFIGPGVARRLRDQAMLAVLLSILVQILYLRFRFRDFTYGFAAAIALVHDVLVTLGLVALFDWLGLVHVKINLPVIAAFLTLIGYSMNDSIVVFDRIRENLGRAIHPTKGLLDASINQTLARSIRTSVTTLAVAMTLLIVNYGAASSLEGFGFVMSIGVILGTYSSIAIASPMLLFLPVYFKRLGDLGKPVVMAMVAALVIGLGMGFALDGVPAYAGAGLAAVLPLHFLFALFTWTGKEDADGLLREVVGDTLARE